MTKMTFGIGGYGEKERKIIATVTSDIDKVYRLMDALQDVGFWTTINERLPAGEKTVIECCVGEIIIQK